MKQVSQNSSSLKRNILIFRGVSISNKMLQNILLCALMPLSIHAVEMQPVHSSVQTYIENKTFENSVQKTDGMVYGIAADIHFEASEYRFAYEKAHTNTKQPPLDRDLNIDKLFLQYAYTFNDALTANVNYITLRLSKRPKSISFF